MNKHILQVFLIVVPVLFSMTSKAQDFFSEDELDTVKKTFYQSNHHITVCAIADPIERFFGASMMVHYNKEKLSLYYDISAKVDGKQSLYAFNAYSDTTAKGNDTAWVSITDTTYKFKAIRFTVGLAAAVTPAFMLYANVGSQYMYDSFTHNIYGDKKYHTPVDKEFNLVYGAGAIYVLPFGLTAQAGLLLPEFSLTVGLGFTF